MSFYELIEKLDAVFATFTEDDKDESGYISNEDKERKATSIIWDIFRLAGGNTYIFQTVMNDHGYRAYPTDKDSFGWLVGCVEKDGYKVSFG